MLSSAQWVCLFLCLCAVNMLMLWRPVFAQSQCQGVEPQHCSVRELVFHLLQKNFQIISDDLVVIFLSPAICWPTRKGHVLGYMETQLILVY